MQNDQHWEEVVWMALNWQLDYLVHAQSPVITAWFDWTARDVQVNRCPLYLVIALSILVSAQMEVSTLDVLLNDHSRIVLPVAMARTLTAAIPMQTSALALALALASQNWQPPMLIVMLMMLT